MDGDRTPVVGAEDSHPDGRPSVGLLGHRDDYKTPEQSGAPGGTRGTEEGGE